MRTMRTNCNVRLIGLSVAILSLLCGCGWDLPGTFRVGSVEVLDHADLGAILPWYAQAPSNSGAVGLLRVEVLSPVDLVLFTPCWAFTPSPTETACRNRFRKVLGAPTG